MLGSPSGIDGQHIKASFPGTLNLTKFAGKLGNGSPASLSKTRQATGLSTLMKSGSTTPAG